MMIEVSAALPVSLYLALELRQMFDQLCLHGYGQLMVQAALIGPLHAFPVLHLQGAEQIDANVSNS